MCIAIALPPEFCTGLTSSVATALPPEDFRMLTRTPLPLGTLEIKVEFLGTVEVYSDKMEPRFGQRSMDGLRKEKASQISALFGTSHKIQLAADSTFSSLHCHGHQRMTACFCSFIHFRMRRMACGPLFAIFSFSTTSASVRHQGLQLMITISFLL